MNGLFALLKTKSMKRKPFRKSEEYAFFLEHRHFLDKFINYRFLAKFDNAPFDVMRANIFLHGIINKKIIEEEIKTLCSDLDNGSDSSKKEILNIFTEKINELPCHNEDGYKICIPFFTKSLNEIYIKEPFKLLTFPYDKLEKEYFDSVIDPFDAFSYRIFNSSFTNLVFIMFSENKKEAAFFHHDTKSIFIINNQGRLDEEIVLFDKYMKNYNFDKILERVEAVVDAYFTFDRSAFVESLYRNGFISHKLLSRLRRGKQK